MGFPAVKAGIGFIPWSNQYVTAIDLKSGDEVARLLVREIVTQARNFNGDLWFGEKGLVRLDDKIRLATTNQATHVELPARQLPGKPLWLGSGNQLWPVSNSARLKSASARSQPRLTAAPTSPTTPTSPATFAWCWGSRSKPAKCASSNRSPVTRWA